MKQNVGQNPKEVLYVWNYLQWGGAQVYFLGIAARLKDRLDVRILFPKSTSAQFADFCRERGLKFEMLESCANWRTPSGIIAKLRHHLDKIRWENEFVKELTRFDLDNRIVHTDLAPWQSLIPIIRLCRRTKVFITMHNALPPVAAWRRKLWKIKLSIAERQPNFHIFTSNIHARESLRGLVSDEFLETVRVTYTNVDPDEIDAALAHDFDRTEMLSSRDLPTDKSVVMCLGQFIDRKGRWTFLEAASKFARDRDDVLFVWISNSDLTDADLEKISGYGLGDKFRLVRSEVAGRTHEELMRFLRCADVFVLPSFVEGLPISLLEAMALGIPSISTNVYAIPEAIHHEKTGLLIEAGDADELASSIERLIRDTEFGAKLGAAGRASVLANFNEKCVADIALTAYLAPISGER